MGAVSLFNEDFTGAPALFKTSDQITYLGVAATILITAEMTRNRILPANSNQPLGSFSDLYPYILRRWGYEQDIQLPQLPVPERFQNLFRTWATRQTDFVKYSNDGILDFRPGPSLGPTGRSDHATQEDAPSAPIYGFQVFTPPCQLLSSAHNLEHLHSGRSAVDSGMNHTESAI